MKKHFMRLAFCFVLAVTAVLCYAVKPQNNNVAYVKADGDCPISNIVEEMPYYGLSAGSVAYAMCYDEYVGSIHICDIDLAHYGAGNGLDVTIYAENHAYICNVYWVYAQDNWNFFLGNVNGYDTILTPGTYYYQIYWEADGDYDSGYMGLDWSMSFVVTPKTESFWFNDTDFENCTYGEYDSWMFASTPFMPNNDAKGEPDDVELAWFYMDGEDEIRLSNTTPAGYYEVYPKFVGSKASWYEISDCQYTEMMMGSRELTKENPAPLTILQKEITVTIQRGYLYLKMYGGSDSPVTNTAYYCGKALPYTADTTIINGYGKPEHIDLGITVEINFWINNKEQAFEEIEELGTYFIDSEFTDEDTGLKCLTLVDGEVSASNFKIKHTNCKVTIEKRRVNVTPDMDGRYTGKGNVIPNYTIDYSPYAPGEWESDIIAPLFNIPEDTLVSQVGEYGEITLEIVDTDHYYFDDGGSQVYTYSWNYNVVPGIPTITLTELTPFYHREIVTDYNEKFSITVETSDVDGDQVQIDDISWNTTGSWHSFTEGVNPEGDMLDRDYVIDRKIQIRVSTSYSVNSNFEWHTEYFELEIAKAPVYMRSTAYLAYNGDWQKPEDYEYNFYIYSVTDDNSNLWATHRPDMPNQADYVESINTSSNLAAGNYPINATLTGYISGNYELVIDDDAVYTIRKVALTVMNFSQVNRNYGDNFYYGAVSLTGFVANQDLYSAQEKVEKVQYNTIGQYVDEDAWLDIEELTEDEHGWARYDVPAGTYYVRYTATFRDYEDVTAYSKVVVSPKVIQIRYFESEESYLNGDEGYKGADLTIYDIVGHYTYDGTEHCPYFVFDGLVNDDKLTPIIYVEDGVNYGIGHLYINNIKNNNYELSAGTACTFEITKATLTVTPDSGFTKIYGQADPEFTYTVQGAVEGDTPVFAGELSRVAGQTAGVYNITIGTLDLTADEVNYNYNLELNATPVTFEIEKKEIVAHFSVLEKEYTSKNLNPDLDYFEGIEIGDVVEITYPTNSIDAGRYDKKYALAGKDAGNYVLNVEEVSFLITQATLNYSAVLDTTNVSLKVEFDNEIHTLTVDPTNIKENDGGKVALNILTNATGTTAGTYVAKLEIIGDRGYNYKFADGKDKVTWTITPKGVADILKVLESAFAGDTVTYDASVHTIKTVSNVNDPEGYLGHYTYEYYLDGESFTGVTNVGTYNVEIRFTSDNTTNYPEVTPVYKELKITQREITITWTDTNYTYDGTNHMPTATLNDVAGDDELKVLFNTTGATNKSTTTVIATGLEGEAAGNYKLGGTTQVTMIISAREITVKAADKESVYGNAIASLTYTITEGTIVEGDDIDSIFTLSCTATTASAVRDYTIKVTKGANKNYDVTTVDGTYNITKRDITITADAKSSVYGDSLETLTAQVTNGSLVNGDLLEDLVNVSTVVTSTSLVADNYLIKVESKGNINYNVTTQNAFYALTPRPITVTAVNKTSVYGEDTVALTATYGVNEPVPGDMPYTLDCEVVKGSEVGTYEIKVRRINNNYTVVGIDAVYTVTARPMTIAIADKTSVYGEARVKLTHEIVKGKYYSDDIASDVFRLNCVVNTTTNVGTYNITGEVINDNYNITFINGTESEPNYDLDHGVYTVTERPLLITIENKTSVYGDAQVALTAVDTNNQIVNGDEGVYALTCEVNAKSHVGTYNIIGSRVNTNYKITFANETDAYAVTKKNLRVIADNKEVVYGDAIPTYTVNYDGFVNGENEAVLGGELEFTSAYTNTSVVNTYAITPSGLTSDDYNIMFIDGTLAVTQKAITVTFTSTHKEVTYGDETAWNALGEEMVTNHFYLAADWVGADTVENSLYYTMVDANNEDISQRLDSTLPVGTYRLVVTGRNVNNYKFTITLGDEAYLKVNKAALTVTADNKTVTYGDAVPTYTVSYNGFVNGEDATVLGGELAFAGQYRQKSSVGTYTITPSGLTSANYEITFVNGTCTVEKKVVTLTWTELAFVYDEQAHIPTATAGALVGDDVVTVTVTGEKVEAGTYTATATNVSDSNYKLPEAKTHEFTISKPATYDKPIDAAKVATQGVDMTQVFSNIDTTTADAKLELNVGTAVVTFNKEAITAIAGNNVVFKFEFTEGEEAKEVVKGAAAVFEISLSDVAFGENGQVTVKMPFENKAGFGKVAKLYYVDADGKKVDMKAVFEGDMVEFTTPHFSTFAVMYQLSTLSIIVIILVVVGALVGVFFLLKAKGVIGGAKAVSAEKETPVTEESEPATEETTTEETPAEETETQE